MGEKVEGEKKAVDGGESVTVVVLNLDLHCEGCAKKVRKAVSRFEGVEKVKTDYTSNKLIVTGNVDPTWLREQVEYRTKKKVDLISPHPKIAAKEPDEISDQKNKQQKKPEDEKQPKEVAITTAVMKIKLHCDGCAHKVRRVITKNIPGVISVVTDLQKNLVTVTGTMNVKLLTSFLEEKLKRTVHTIPPPSAAGAGEEKKVEVNKMEHRSLNSQTFYYNQSYDGGHGYGHVAEYYSGSHVAEHYRPWPPGMDFDDQMFSDENPTGCSVM